MGKKIVFIMTISIIVICSYFFISKFNGKGEEKITNINIYKDTPAWDLAVAVKKQKISTIEKIVKKQPELLNYKEPKYDASLLLWAVGMEKYESTEALLKCGADPNIASAIRYGETPLLVASAFSWIDNEAKKDAKYVKLLLQYGADPNKNYNKVDEKKIKTITSGGSPLMNSMRCGIEKTKALVEAGADINYKNQNGYTAAIAALDVGGPNATIEGMQYSHYLIAEKKAKVSEPYYINSYSDSDPNKKFFPVDILRNWLYDLDSENHKIKMEIVEEFTAQGVNYWNAPINKITLEQIKKHYQDTWEDYVKKY